MKIWSWIRNCGDGSCAIQFFDTEANAEAAAESDSERNSDDVTSHDLPLRPNTKFASEDGQASKKWEWYKYKKGELLFVDEQEEN